MARRDIGSGGGDSSVTQGTDPWNIKIDQTGSNNDVDILSIAAGSNLIGKVQLRNPGNTADMGDATTPVRIDPTGTTRQPVDPISGQIGVRGGSGLVDALTQRVTLATDVSLPAGTNNIGDVDILSIATGDNLIGRVKLSDGTDVADIFDLTNSNPLAVAIVDSLGDQITSFGGGTQYTEGDVDATITGTAAMMEGAGNTLLPVQGTVADGLLVNLGANNDISGTVTANQGTPASTANRWPVQITDGTDLALVTQPSVDNISGANMTGANVVAANYYLDGSTWDAARGDATAGAWIQGAVAQGGAEAGNPVPLGINARTTNPTAVSDNTRVKMIGDDIGRPVVVLNQVRDLVSHSTTTISTTTETTILAAVASTFLDIVYLILTNTSQSSVRVDIRDSTAGTIRLSIGLAPKGGAVIQVPVPITQATVNNNWTAQLSAAVTDVRIFAQAVRNI